MGIVEFSTANGTHTGFSSYGTIDELEALVTSLIHDGFTICDINAW